MLHLTFNIRCSIACLCMHLPSSPESLHLPLMGFPHSETAMQTPAYGLSLLWVLPPLGILTLQQGFSPLRVPGPQLRWWNFSYSKATVNPTPLLGFSPLIGQKFRGTTDETIPFWNNIASLPNRFRDRPTIPVIEISTPERRDHFDFKKVNGKASQARSI